jgi:hypothetical protein
LLLDPTIWHHSGQMGHHGTRIRIHFFFFLFFFSRGDKMPKNGGLLSWIAIIITTQYLSSRQEENVQRLQCSPTFGGGAIQGASGAADCVGSKEWIQPFGLLIDVLSSKRMRSVGVLLAFVYGYCLRGIQVIQSAGT